MSSESDRNNDAEVGSEFEAEAEAEVEVEAEVGSEFEAEDYLADLQRVTADFANFKKQVERRNIETATRARAALVERLLPILDACDSAISQGAEDVSTIYHAILGALKPVGLEVIDPKDELFDPTFHEAITHEPSSEGGDSEPKVTEVLRRGYTWEGQILRPAMVKVQG